ncbi:MAG: hypothetical protein DMD37_11610 [Gemmatimonadetes bacterium]|nr:MAG: hypothetical protein DMD71_00580 [Gemmatimonadota bacterium]PYO82849.1 MAG: hypothetical protein DMD68_10805 [Gemmatimonadota bacterium]PYP62051.1 MAG: hypothetical protein DMD37_11610 [Gemmatimonadota bacterium]
MGARPAGLANSAPASPTSAAPAPPRPAERVEPGSAASGLPSDCAVSGAARRNSPTTPGRMLSGSG